MRFCYLYLCWLRTSSEIMLCRYLMLTFSFCMGLEQKFVLILSRKCLNLPQLQKPIWISHIFLVHSSLHGLFYCYFLWCLVYEKQQKLRIMMKMHGLGDGPYIIISYSYFLLISLLYVIVLVMFGSLLGIDLTFLSFVFPLKKLTLFNSTSIFLTKQFAFLIPL